MEDDYDKMKPVTFVVAFTVHASWVADGFVLTDERAKGMLANDLRGGYGHEMSARLLHLSSTPDYVYGRLQGAEGAWLKKELAEFKDKAPTYRALRNLLSRDIPKARAASVLHLLSPGTIIQGAE